MNIELIVVGKTDMKEVEALVQMYTKRLNHYVRFAITTIADVRIQRYADGYSFACASLPHLQTPYRAWERS